MKDKKQWYCRWSPTLGDLEDSHQNTWGTIEYNPKKHINQPTVFAGLYSLVDFYALWRHKGKKYVWFTGSDIRHLRDGYWLDDKGELRIPPTSLALWINKNCESWVENEVEQMALKKVGIDSKVCPSFLGDINKFEVSYKPSYRPKVYTSVSGDDFELYRWQEAVDLADRHTDIEFHFYGNRKPFAYVSDRSNLDNIFIHGRVPKEQMNEEIKEMQGALRLLPLEGFSEIIAKSVLWGQWPISAIKYPYILSVDELETLKTRQEPNLAGREYYKKTLNSYPWNSKK